MVTKFSNAGLLQCCLYLYYKWRNVLHIGFLVEKIVKPHSFNMNNYISLIVSRSSRRLLKFVLPGKLLEFWNFTSFQAKKISTCFMAWSNGLVVKAVLNLVKGPVS